MEPVFRAAVAGDWPGIWHVFQQVVATGDTYPYLPGIPEAEARDSWMARGHDVSVAILGEEIAGTAYFRANIVGLGDHIANAGWMVAPDFQGQGIGRGFADYVMGRAREAGFQGMQFNAVVSTNLAAIALWEALGFEIVGTVPDAFRHATRGPVAIHIMYREL